jgi:hypothetical protein
VSLAALVSAALVSLAHLGQVSADRLAAPIADVATTEEEALLLAVTLDAEGGVRPAVLDCRILGDHGHAFGGYQLHRQHIRGSIAEFCRDPYIQAELALRALSHGKTIRTRIAAFMGRRENDREVSRRVIRYERLLGSRS